ncbi:hypothetical protein Bbelb_001730 [Branchiostoma belcheri]|nr:hypothetical protein Bbelb_001730 [Branchiostoma belcheri]
MDSWSHRSDKGTKSRILRITVLQIRKRYQKRDFADLSSTDPKEIPEAGFYGSRFCRSENDTRSGVLRIYLPQIRLRVFGPEEDVMSIQTHRIVTCVASFGAPSPLHGGPAHLIQHIGRLQGVLQAEPPHPEDVIKTWGTFCHLRNWIIALKVKKPYSKRLKLKLSGVHVTRRASL